MSLTRRGAPRRRLARVPRRRSRVNETLGQQAAAQRIEVEVASMVAEALDDAIERRPRFNTHQPAEPARDADVARREHVEAPETTQEDQTGAPGANARKLGQVPDRLVAAHAREHHLGQLARLDRAGDVAKRLGLPKAHAAFSELDYASLRDDLSCGEGVEATAVMFE